MLDWDCQDCPVLHSGRNARFFPSAGLGLGGLRDHILANQASELGVRTHPHTGEGAPGKVNPESNKCPTLGLASMADAHPGGNSDPPAGGVSLGPIFPAVIPSCNGQWPGVCIQVRATSSKVHFRQFSVPPLATARTKSDFLEIPSTKLSAPNTRLFALLR
ncbi:hypothetical protein B0T20DRAFT_395312 [Sordaria brevicollis]|uniref:Uncharacterized protein n=1 Tax=Sordaria brevicollis TaxID=83679 RepID=A0AAE0U9E1_SORBR|nr:hypothetical protein B0T20DRAFT_395312 [Sordaria brevicollis]